MAFSNEIAEYKNIIISNICDNYELIRLIDEKYVDNTTQAPVNSYELIHKKIFPYYYNPSAITEAISFIIIKIDTPKVESKLIKDMSITITVVSNQDIMEVDYGTGTRIDQMGVCIDKLFNGRDDLGFGYLELASNYESSLDTVHRCREMKFKVNEFNDIRSSL